LIATQAATRLKRVFCGVDFSPGSLAAFRAAAETARLHSGALHVFHAIEPRPAVPADVMLKIVERANAAMAQLLESEQSVLNGLALTTEVTSGRAFDEIIERARKWKAELIVIGAKGITSLEEVFAGGTAEAVTREAHCSVLIVRPDNKM
jgi:nucleotide-binding universal stress UspA family protein